jgi:hypothetical protein
MVMRLRRPAAGGVGNLLFLATIGTVGIASAGFLFAAGFGLMLSPNPASRVLPAPSSPVRPTMTTAARRSVAARTPPAAPAAASRMLVEVAQTPVVAAPKAAAPVPAAPVAADRRLPAAAVALGQGDARFRADEVAAARFYFERAFDAGDAEGAVRLGETFDPAFLDEGRLRRVRASPVAARFWYRRAADLGSAAAHQRLAFLDTEPATAPALDEAQRRRPDLSTAVAAGRDDQQHSPAAPTFHELLERILHPPRN